MKLEAKNNRLILKEVYSGVTLETAGGKQLHICLRDQGFDIKLEQGSWHHVSGEKDFAAPAQPNGFQQREPDFPVAALERIEDFGLSNRATEALKLAGVETLSDLKKLDLDDVAKIRKVGRMTLIEIKEFAREYDIILTSTQI